MLKANGDLVSGDFIEGVFENWESEFLQMWALVVLTIYLRQKGSDESKPMRGKVPQETDPRYKLSAANTWSKRFIAVRHTLYSHSLNLVLMSIFLAAFLMHAVGGSMAYNEDSQRHGSETVSVLSCIGTSQFWYESFQNRLARPTTTPLEVKYFTAIFQPPLYNPKYPGGR